MPHGSWRAKTQSGKEREVKNEEYLFLLCDLCSLAICRAFDVGTAPWLDDA